MHLSFDRQYVREKSLSKLSLILDDLYDASLQTIARFKYHIDFFSFAFCPSLFLLGY